MQYNNPLKLLLIILILAPVTTHAELNVALLTDEEISHLLIQQSVAGYDGKCPCPEHADRLGKRWGVRSARFNNIPHQPLCYPSDVTPDMIENFRVFHLGTQHYSASYLSYEESCIYHPWYINNHRHIDYCSQMFHEQHQRFLDHMNNYDYYQ